LVSQGPEIEDIKEISLRCRRGPSISSRYLVEFDDLEA
jgi:hypothetical protein